MQIQIKVFGQLTDIVNCSEFVLNSIADTDSLVKELHKLYPALTDKNFLIAVDKKAIAGNTILHNGSTVALMPPFSGG